MILDLIEEYDRQKMHQGNRGSSVPDVEVFDHRWEGAGLRAELSMQLL